MRDCRGWDGTRRKREREEEKAAKGSERQRKAERESAQRPEPKEPRGSAGQGLSRSAPSPSCCCHSQPSPPTRAPRWHGSSCRAQSRCTAGHSRAQREPSRQKSSITIVIARTSRPLCRHSHRHRWRRTLLLQPLPPLDSNHAGRSRATPQTPPPGEQDDDEDEQSPVEEQRQRQQQPPPQQQSNSRDKNSWPNQKPTWLPAALP